VVLFEDLWGVYGGVGGDGEGFGGVFVGGGEGGGGG
jgi:hypothetical protein